jgi:hypothetical protein
MGNGWGPADCAKAPPLHNPSENKIRKVLASGVIFGIP